MKVLAFVLAVVLAFVAGVASVEYCPYVQRVLNCGKHTKCVCSDCDCCGCCKKCECKDCTCCPACPGKANKDKCNKAKPCCSVKE